MDGKTDYDSKLYNQSDYPLMESKLTVGGLNQGDSGILDKRSLGGLKSKSANATSRSVKEDVGEAGSEYTRTPQMKQTMEYKDINEYPEFYMPPYTFWAEVQLIQLIDRHI